MTNETTNTEQSRISADCPNERIVSCKTCNDTGHVNVTCCGRPVVGAEYMGQQEIICCGEPDSEPCPDCDKGN